MHQPPHPLKLGFSAIQLRDKLDEIIKQGDGNYVVFISRHRRKYLANIIDESEDAFPINEIDHSRGFVLLTSSEERKRGNGRPYTKKETSL